MASAVDKKEKEGENVTVTDRKATVIKSEMSEEMTANATRWCNQALDKCKEGTPNQEREIAKHVKEQFDKQYGATWHCGFGSNFGAHVTYEEGRFLLFNVGQYNLILWKHMMLSHKMLRPSRKKARKVGGTTGQRTTKDVKHRQRRRKHKSMENPRAPVVPTPTCLQHRTESQGLQEDAVGDFTKYEEHPGTSGAGFCKHQ